MNAEERAEQEQLHEDLTAALPLEEGQVLTGWVVIYETVDGEDVATCGHFYGPGTMTSWHALGLAEYAARHTITGPDPDEGG